MTEYKVWVASRETEVSVLYAGPEWIIARAAWDVGRSSVRDRGRTLRFTETTDDGRVVRDVSAPIM